MENVMMAYLENMAEPALDVENFIEEEEELAEPIELDQTEVPSEPSIELKPLPSGLRYDFLDDNRETPVIISDKLSQEETQKLVAILERHKAPYATSSKISKGLVPLFALIESLLILTFHHQGNHKGDLTMLCARLLRKRS